MKDILEIELKVLEGRNQVVIVCAETGREIGFQSSTVVESSVDGATVANVTFNIPPKKDTEKDTKR